MANSPSGYNSVGLPILTDAQTAGGMFVVVDTELPGGSSPQGAAVSLNSISGGTFGVVAAFGATQGNATVIPALTQRVQVTVTASTEGVMLPVSSTGKVRRLFVPGTVGVKIYPPVGGAIDALSLNAALTLAAGKGIEFTGTDATHWRTSMKGA